MMDVMAARIRKRHIAERGGLDWCGRSGHPYLPPGTVCEQCQIITQMFWWLWEEDEQAHVAERYTRMVEGHVTARL